MGSAGVLWTGEVITRVAVAFLGIAAVVEDLDQSLAATFRVDQRMGLLIVAEKTMTHELGNVSLL